MRTSMLLVIAACGSACGVPDINASVRHTVDMRLGRMTSGCNTSGAVSPVDGSRSSFVHRMEGDVCLTTAQWSGPLIDMARLRDEIRGDIVDSRDFAELEIRHADIDVDHVRLRDADDDSLIADVDASILRYQGRLGLDAATPLVTFDFENDLTSDPDDPHHDVQNEDALAAALNRNLASGAAVTGTGSLTMQVDADRLDPLIDARDPALQIEYTIGVRGGDR
jgi:hypothetical protein